MVKYGIVADRHPEKYPDLNLTVEQLPVLRGLFNMMLDKGYGRICVVVRKP